MKKVLIVGTLLLLGGNAFAEDASDYIRLYQADALANDSRVNGDANKAQAFTDCHMMAMAAFPDAMQDTAFRTASQTQDYEQARSAFVTLLATEMTSGVERKAVIESVIAESKSLGEACMVGLKL